MDRNFKWRALVVAAVIVIALVCLYPTLAPKGENGDPALPDFWKTAGPTNTIGLGLDLMGGMHVVLEVQVGEAVDGAIKRQVEEIKLSLRNEKLATREVKLEEQSQRIEIWLTKSADLDALNKILDREYDNLVTQTTFDEDGGTKIILTPNPTWVQQTKERAVDQALETIRNRINSLGVTEPDIRPQGKDRIVVQLPGVTDPDKAKSVLKRVAHLEFKIVVEGRSAESALAEGLPPGAEVLYEIETNPQTGRETKRGWLLRSRALMDGSNITDAHVSVDRFNNPYVSLSFNSEGARQFGRITEANVNKQLAIVLDDRVYSAPNINEPITGGKAQISGRFPMNEAKELALVLRSGSLPAPVEFLEERTVGPSLGEDSIRQGFTSIIVGMILVLLFMIIYYRMAGIIADVAVILNMFLIMSAMAVAGATLTLPGIAGMILTIGMAVDANVLIFERIREEIRLGKSPRAAVDGGFGKALWTILDANVTTLIAAVVLLQFGTGPIRGFAITLSIGIVASMFTAIFVSRLIFDYLLVGLKMKAVSV